MMRRQAHEQEAGFTLVELLVSLSIVGVMTGLAVNGWSGYASASEHSGTRNDVVSALRAASSRAVTEAKPYCVTFDVSAGTWTTHRLSCAGATVKGPEEVEGGHVVIADAGFLQPDGSTQAQVLFTARGTASKGSLKVRRTGSSKVYTISVEGLTGRVSSN
jgi:type II secretion system protein H